jgi:TPR repeat protein
VDHKDDKEAVKWFRLAAQQNLAVAQFNLGLMYSEAWGVDQDLNEALKWYRLAAEQGLADAQSNLGMMYRNCRGVDHKDDKEAVKWFRLAAQQNLAVAQFNLGLMYAEGRGLDHKDDKEAVKWFRLAAEQGSARAQSSLGMMYAEGRGVDNQDDREAVKWFRLAAHQNLAVAQFNLGLMYLKGRGVDHQDDKEAVKWFRLAAVQRNAEAQSHLGVMYADGRGVDHQDDKEAVKWFHLAAQQNLAVAQYNLGNHYLQGRGVDHQDDKEAAKWYRLAAEQGLAESQNDLGVMYMLGRGVDHQDDREAVKWFRKAGEQGLAESQNNLGLMYADGRGVGKDYKEAAKWFRMAAQQGHARAHHHLVLALKNQGEFAEAKKVAEAYLNSRPAAYLVRRAVSELLKECERLLALDNKRTEILQGKSKPANADEQAQLALLCLRYKRLPATATRFFAAAFAIDRKLANDLASSYRYHAACSAALAAASKGDDATKLDAKERIRLRQLALAWLQADLIARRKQLDSWWPRTASDARRALQHWQKDPDLASVRDKAALDRLPESEPAAWRKLWDEVAKLLADKEAPRKAGGAAAARPGRCGPWPRPSFPFGSNLNGTSLPSHLRAKGCAGRGGRPLLRSRSVRISLAVTADREGGPSRGPGLPWAGAPGTPASGHPTPRAEPTS